MPSGESFRDITDPCEAAVIGQEVTVRGRGSRGAAGIGKGEAAGLELGLRL